MRLCFQAFIEDKEKQKIEIPLEPVISDIIYDKKTMTDLCILALSHEYAAATSQQSVIVLCRGVMKDNIQVRFFEEHNGQIVWEAMVDVLPRNVSKNAIEFRIPKYRLDYINQPVECHLQLCRKTDTQVSPARRFFYFPDSAFQPINFIVKNMLQYFGNFANRDLSLNNYSNHSLVPNGLVTSANLSQNLVANNLANCLTTNLSNFPTNLVNNLSIQNHLHHQQQVSNLQNSSTIQMHQSQMQPNSATLSSPIGSRKRCKTENEQDQAYDLALSAKKSLDNQRINNFHSTLNQANAAKNFEAMNNANSMSNSVNTIPNSVSITFASTNANTTLTNRENQVEPMSIDCPNQLYHVKYFDFSDSTKNANTSNGHLNNTVVDNGFSLNNLNKN